MNGVLTETKKTYSEMHKNLSCSGKWSKTNDLSCISDGKTGISRVRHQPKIRFLHFVLVLQPLSFTVAPEKLFC